jgi:hypothetical protein
VEGVKDPGVTSSRGHLDDRRRSEKHSEPIALSREYLDAIGAIEQWPSNQDGADKAWVHRAMDDVRAHFSRVKRV